MRILILISSALLLSCSHTGGKSKYAGFGLDSISKANLDKYAPPAPDPLLKSQIEKLVDIRSASAGVVTNDGRTLFTNWNVTGSSQLWRLNGPKSFPVQLTGGEDRGSLVGLSPDNKWLVISRDSKGDENPGLYLMHPNGGSLKKIYYNPKHQTSIVDFTEDSKALYYTTNDKSPSSYSIYKYTLATDQHELVWDKPGLWDISDIEGDLAILTLNTGSMQNEHSLFNLKTKSIVEPLIGQGEQEDFSVQFTNKKGEYLVTTNKIGDFRRIYILKNKKLEPYSKEQKADISRASLSHNRRYLAYGVNNKGYNQIFLEEFPSKKNIPLPKFGAVEQQSIGSFSKNDRYLTMSTEHHDYPARNYVFDISSRRTTDWIVPSTPEVDTKNFVRGELMSYKAADGTDIPMFVWRSEKCKKEVCPVVVQFHGGPESQFIPRFSPIYNLYTERGFVFVAPNVRGSDGYGKTWLRADNGVNRLKVITDIRDCAEYIKKNWAKNGKAPKIGITGGSYGGYSTLVGVSMFADSYDAGAAIVGMSSLITFIENTAPYRRALRMNEYGDPAKDREAMLKLSPVSYLDKVTKPLLVLHGATDPRVPVGEAIQLHETVSHHNKNARLIIYPDEGHGVAKRPNIVLNNSYIVDFFEKHLK